MRKSMVFEGVVTIVLILLLFLMLAMMLGGSAEKAVSGIGDIQYTYAGVDNTLYVFSGNVIRAIDGSGTQQWTFRIPGQWGVCSYGYYPGILRPDGKPSVSAGSPIVSSGDGVLYVYLKPIEPGTPAYYMDGALMAISDGKELWELPVTGYNISYLPFGNDYFSDDSSQHFSDTRVYAAGDRVYVFHDFNETVIGKNGTVLWNIGNVSDPAAVDGRGFVYCVRSPVPDDQKYPYSVYLPDYREPSDTIDAYYPNGTLYWESRTENPLARQYTEGDTPYLLPLYDNGTVYAPMYDGVTAISQDGKARWTKTYAGTDFKFDWPFDPGNLTESQQQDINAYEAAFKASTPAGPRLPVQNGIEVSLGLYSAMSFDSEGNVYLQCISDIPVGSLGYLYCREMFIVAISPEGKEISRAHQYDNTYVAAKDGIGYATGVSLQQLNGTAPLNTINSMRPPSNLTDLESNRLVACGVESGKELWSYTFATKDPTVVTLDSDNVYTLIDRYEADAAINNARLNGTEEQTYPLGSIVHEAYLQVSPGDGVTYASFQSLNFENPIVLGQSKCAYTGGIYAFDNNGSLLWYQSTPPINSGSMQVTQNGTVFFRTPDGKIGVTGAGIAGGFTLTALAYLFLRFFCVGAVAKAKARMNRNGNRSGIYDFIVRNPGSTVYEISRGIGVNLGTVRYHMLILGMNHKIIASRMDGKYIRYFTNSNSYTRDEQLILSLMRRDAVGRVLGLMMKRPGISNVEVARELGIPESVVCRCVKELSERGVIAREPAGKGCFVGEAYREHVAAAMRRILGE